MANIQAYEGLDAKQIMTMMSSGGASQENQQMDLLPLLKINYQEEDSAGNELKKGMLVLGATPEDAVYAKDAQFRVLGDFMQYLHWDADKEEVVNRSIVHRMGDEPIDERGTLRCGRPAGKDFHALSDEQKKKYQGITCFRYLYGVLTMAGATATGEERTIDSLPCLFRTKGSAFLNFTNEVIKGCDAKGITFQQVTNTMTTERHKKGSVTYFTPHFSPNFENVHEISEADVGVMREILSTIAETNGQIRKKYDEALRSKQSSPVKVEEDYIEIVEDEIGF